MASPTQLVQFTFAGGIDQAIRGEIVDPTAAFTLLQNARQDERGALTKRRGLAARSATRMDGTSISAGLRAFSMEKLAYVADGTHLNEYSPTASRWVSRGRLPEAELSMIGLPGVGSSSGYAADVIVCGNYMVALVATTAGSVSVVLDARTGGIVRDREIMNATTDTPMLATYGGNVVMAFFWRNSDGTIRYQWIDLTSVSSINTGWSSSIDAATDQTPAPTWLTMSVTSLSDRAALIYVNDSAGTNRVNVKTFTASGVIDAATMTTAAVSVSHVAIAPDGAGGLVAAWNETTNVMVSSLSSALAVSGTPTACITGYSSSTSANHPLDIMGSGTAGAGRVFASWDSDATGARMSMRDFTTSAGAVAAGGSQIEIYNVRRIGRVFRYGTRYYALCRGWEAAKRDAVVCDLSDTAAYVRPVANIRPALATGKAHAQASAYGTSVYLPVTTQTSGSTYAGELAALDFGSTQRSVPARFGRSLFLSGSLLAEYDGQRVFESAFLIRPPKPTTSLGGTGLTGTNYRYVAVYEHVDALGNWHVSGVSDPSAAVSPANETVTVTLRPLSISGRLTATTDAALRISVYRTLSGGEPPYYYVASVDNTLTAATQTYADASSDATISANAKLYAPSLPGINGGSQDHRAPPGLTHLEAGNGVLVGAHGEELWHSSQPISGEGLWWSPVFTGLVPGDGPITGLKYQDGTFYVFKRRAIYAVTCEPPTDNGAAGGLGLPRRLAVDVGCVDNRSLLVTSFGIFFQSERGIELLTRAQGVEWIGEGIQSSLATSTVVGATLDAVTGLVYFETNGSGALVYDLSRRIWQSVDTRSATPVGGALVWDQSQSAYRYAYLSGDGALWVEQSAYLDASSTWITMRARTGWVKLGGIQGQQIMNRALLLAKRNGDGDVKIAAAYDYDTTFETATEWTSATLSSLSTALGRVQVGHDLHSEAEGQAVALDIYDEAPSGGVGDGAGQTWIALTFEGQPRANAVQLSEEAR